VFEVCPGAERLPTRARQHEHVLRVVGVERPDGVLEKRRRRGVDTVVDLGTIDRDDGDFVDAIEDEGQRVSFQPFQYVSSFDGRRVAGLKSVPFV
jgi:hypothetical protein